MSRERARAITAHAPGRGELQRLAALISRESGMALDRERQAALQTAVAERMAARGAPSTEAYCALLASRPDGKRELEALVDALTVGETYFFRNMGQFEVLRDHVIPACARARSAASRTLSVWSAACSTGEEPYSLAMLLLETLPDPATWQISILATDVHRARLARAAKGVYGPRAVRAVPPGWLRAYFTVRGDAYAVRDDVKKLVRFAHHNLAIHSYEVPGMSDLDVVLCRNALIYLRPDAAKRIVDNFADCLRDGGYLFTGDAETLWQLSNRFTAVEFPGAVVYRKATAAPPFHDGATSGERASTVLEREVPETRTVGPEPHSAAEATMAAARAAYERGVEAARQKRYAQALADFDLALQGAPDAAPIIIAKASVLANQGNDDEAAALLGAVVRADNLAGDAYYPLGVLYQRMGRWSDAIVAFERTLYVDPGSAMAYVSLGTIYQTLRDCAQAMRAFRNALALLDGKPDDEPVRFADDVTCGYLRSACRQSLAHLERTIER